MSQSDQKVTFTVPEAAELMGISRGLAYEMVRRGDVPSIKLGRRLLVPRAALETLLGRLEDAPHDAHQPAGPVGAAAVEAPTKGDPVTAYLCIPVTLENWSPPTIDIR